jgi:putative pyruvate formate lyase activating enzyme
MEALYIEAHRTGLLAERVAEAMARLGKCDLCPRECGVDRLAGERGYCGSGATAEISSAGPHYGEEPPLVGRGGSGTIFLTHCGLRCVFCQNDDISHEGRGREIDAEELAGVMVELQRHCCHNINFVTPSHYLPQILEALDLAVPLGLELPLVWNCGGYEKVDALRLLDGIVDIYMPDVKFSGAGPAGRYCDAPDYWERARSALREMHRQVGDLDVGSGGLARRGLLVRHLVLPGSQAGTEEVAAFLAQEISTGTYVNVMDQYRPCCRAGEFPEIARPVTPAEYETAIHLARGQGLHRGFC